jgi:hypothetical protein
MRTKTLLLSAAALGAVGLVTASAQVFSVNAVGYINVTVPPGFTLIANQLNNGNNTLAEVIPNAPDATIIYKWTGTGWNIAGFDEIVPGEGEWDTPNLTLAPGEGAWIRNTSDQPFTLTFVGEVPQGNLSNPFPQGFSIRSSEVPQAGLLSTDLGFVPSGDSTIYQWRDGGWVIRGYDEIEPGVGEWVQEPNVNVGEAFWLNSGGAGTWTRTFNVNQQ